MHEVELLAAIRANPEDDTPRMLYADALGNARGQYIQHRLKGLDAPDAWAIEQAWKAELGFGAETYVYFDRGFPYGVNGPAAKIAACRNALATYPITRLQTGLDGFEPLASLEELRFIRDFRISGKPGIVDARHLAPTHFEEYGVITDANAHVWASAPWFAKLEYFETQNSSLTGAGIAALFAHGMPALRELRATAKLGDRGAEALVAANTRLEKLVLLDSDIGEAGGRALFGSPLMEHIREIEIRSSLGRGIEALTRAPKLYRLNLENCKLGASAASIARADLPALFVLKLAMNALTVEVSRAFATTNGLPALHQLDLAHNELGLDGIVPFEHLQGLPALRILGLLDNKILIGKTSVYRTMDFWDDREIEVDIEPNGKELAQLLKLRPEIRVS